MTAKNEITGDAIRSRPSTDKYRDGWDRIFLKRRECSESEKRNTDQTLNEDNQEVDSNER